MASSPTLVAFISSRRNSGVRKAVAEAVTRLNATLISPGDDPNDSRVIDAVNEIIGRATVVVVDLTEASPNVMLAIGIAQASSKPLLPIALRYSDIPSNLASVQFLLYGDLGRELFVSRVSSALGEIFAHPARFDYKSAVEERKKKQSIFVSYSHTDREYLDRLVVHLQPLKKMGLLDIWVDTHLRAGDRWKQEIEKALDRATVAVLIVSADFLASDFIVDNELPPLLKAAEEKGTRIIPVIAKPCRFTRDEHLKHFQSINDPKEALVLLGYGDQERIYDLLSAEIESQIRNR